MQDAVASGVLDDPLYDSIATANPIWPSKIYQTFFNITSSSVCSALCTLTSANCLIYVYQTNTSSCHLGSIATMTSLVSAPTNSSEIVHTRIPGNISLKVKFIPKHLALGLTFHFSIVSLIF